MNEEERPSGTLAKIVNNFGYPSFYDYFGKENKLIIYYISKEDTSIYILLPFFIKRDITYHSYYFQFNINRENVKENRLQNPCLPIHLYALA
jgi:hypothetical protein